MNERTQIVAAPAMSRQALHTKTGWIFVTATIFPGLEKTGVVQRFASMTTEHVHEVRIVANALGCTCPGWRKYAKCWHVRWVLANNFADLWTLGSWIGKWPSQVQGAEMSRNNQWASWLSANVAVVGREMRPAAAA